MKVARNLSKSHIMAAAVAMGLSISRTSMAAGLPYSTGFETTPDSAGNTYAGSPTGVNLITQNTWAYLSGEGTSPATVITTGAIDGSQSVQLSTLGTAGGATTLHPIYTDVYKTDLTASLPSNANLSFNFDLKAALGTNGSAGAQAGVEIIDANTDNIIASMFVANEANGTPDLLISDGANGEKNVPLFATAGDGVEGNYTLSVNASTGQFTVLYGGQSVSSAIFAGETPGTPVLISLATVDQGGSPESAVFDNLSVVPEPASVGMISVGGLIMLAKRRRARIA
jgi:hypothetical protein